MSYISPLLAAQLSSAIYRGQREALVPSWEQFNNGENALGICWATTRSGDALVVVFRGSITFEDWLRDALALANPFDAGPLGPVHPGFIQGLGQTWVELRDIVRSAKSWHVVGHSLGAARANIITAMAVLDGIPPTSCVTFGLPKPGFAKLAGLVNKVTNISYRNCDGLGHSDLVTHLPFTIPPAEHYVHPFPPIPVFGGVEQRYNDVLGMFALHHMDLYVKALGA